MKLIKVKYVKEKHIGECGCTLYNYYEKEPRFIVELDQDEYVKVVQALKRK